MDQLTTESQKTLKSVDRNIQKARVDMLLCARTLHEELVEKRKSMQEELDRILDKIYKIKREIFAYQSAIHEMNTKDRKLNVINNTLNAGYNADPVMNFIMKQQDQKYRNEDNGLKTLYNESITQNQILHLRASATKLEKQIKILSSYECSSSIYNIGHNPSGSTEMAQDISEKNSVKEICDTLFKKMQITNNLSIQVEAAFTKCKSIISSSLDRAKYLLTHGKEEYKNASQELERFYKSNSEIPNDNQSNDYHPEDIISFAEYMKSLDLDMTGEAHGEQSGD